MALRRLVVGCEGDDGAGGYYILSTEVACPTDVAEQLEDHVMALIDQPEPAQCGL